MKTLNAAALMELGEFQIGISSMPLGL